MGQEVVPVRLDQLRVALEDEQVLGVLMLGLIGEVVTAGDQRALGEGRPGDAHSLSRFLQGRRNSSIIFE